MGSLRERVAAFVEKWSVNRVNSWWGHAAQGIAFTAIIGGALLLLGAPWGPVCGWSFSEGAFVHREADGFLQDWFRDGIGEAWARAREDGLMDLMAPHLSGGITCVLMLILVG